MLVTRLVNFRTSGAGGSSLRGWAGGLAVMLAISAAISVNFEATMKLESLTVLLTASNPKEVPTPQG